MVGAFVPVALKDPAALTVGKEEALKISRLLAAVAEADCRPFLVLADDNGTDPVRTRNAGRVQPGMGLSEEEWNIFAKGAEGIARAVREETGLETVFHHHCAGHVETPEEIAELLKRTDPSLINLVFDTGHYAYGTGQNGAECVLEGLDRFSDRIRHIHFKDCEPNIASQARHEGWDYFDAVKQGVFCDLGKGFVDFPGVTAWLRGRNYRGWIVVEQDVLPGMGVPKDSARRNREYLRRIGL
jgi:inosose dehydratase